jgi:hypothetical protein
MTEEKLKVEKWSSKEFSNEHSDEDSLVGQMIKFGKPVLPESKRNPHNRALFTSMCSLLRDKFGIDSPEPLVASILEQILSDLNTTKPKSVPQLMLYLTSQVPQ